MRFAVIENGRVENVIEAESAEVFPQLQLVKDTKGKAIIGGSWSEVSGFSPPVEPEAAPATPEEVDRERDRRTDAGFDFLGTTFQSRSGDRENISGAAQLAFMAIVGGAQPGDLRWHGGDTDFVWIAADNSLVPMDAHTVVAFGKAAAAHKQKLIFAARALKDGEFVPDDFTADSYWQ